MLQAFVQETVEKGLVTITVFTVFDRCQGWFGLVWFGFWLVGLFYATCVSHISCLVFSKSNNIWLNILRQLQKNFRIVT